MVEAKWITEMNVRNFFGLQNEHLQFLSSQMVHDINQQIPSASTASRPVYWLFQVYDFCRIHKSQEAAEEGLIMYGVKKSVMKYGKEGESWEYTGAAVLKLLRSMQSS